MGGGGAADIWICLWGGGGQSFSDFFATSGTPDGKSVILAAPRLQFLGGLPPPMGNLSFWRPPDDSFRVFYPPPKMGNLSFWDPQMTVSGCFTPP